MGNELIPFLFFFSCLFDARNQSRRHFTTYSRTYEETYIRALANIFIFVLYWFESEAALRILHLPFGLYFFSFLFLSFVSLSFCSLSSLQRSECRIARERFSCRIPRLLSRSSIMQSLLAKNARRGSRRRNAYQVRVTLYLTSTSWMFCFLRCDRGMKNGEKKEGKKESKGSKCYRETNRRRSIFLASPIICKDRFVNAPYLNFAPREILQAARPTADRN